MGGLGWEVAEDLADVVAKYISGQISRVPRDKSQPPWVSSHSLDDCLGHFDWHPSRLRPLFRAGVRPYRLPALIVTGHGCEVASATIKARLCFCDSGHVLDVDNEGSGIKCSDSRLVVQHLIDTDRRGWRRWVFCSQEQGTRENRDDRSCSLRARSTS